MQPHLPLSLLTEKEELCLSELFPDNAFDLLGENLKTWIKKVLHHLEATHQHRCCANLPAGVYVEGRVYIAESAVIETGAFIRGPAVIGPGSEVRHGAYIRGNVFIGSHCVVGHTTEVKGSCFLDGAKAGHFAYVGDSLLGKDTNLGAGTKIANLKLNKSEVKYKDPDTGRISPTGLKKFGAILGSRAQTGCNAVLSPGSILMPDTGVYPASHFKGTLMHGFFKA